RLPHVSGIITTPTLRPDGSLLAEPGYDPETELYLAPGFQIPPIPEHPTREQALAALKLLIDLLSEFGFKRSIGGEHEMRLNRSVALSGLLTPLVRGSLSVSQRSNNGGTRWTLWTSLNTYMFLSLHSRSYSRERSKGPHRSHQ